MHTHSAESVPTSPDILFLVLHGGSVYDSLSSHTSMGSNLDFSTFQQNVETITELHFSSAIGRVAMRMMSFKDICKDALQLLSQVSEGGDNSINNAVREVKCWNEDVFYIYYKWRSKSEYIQQGIQFQ